MIWFCIKMVSYDACYNIWVLCVAEVAMLSVKEAVILMGIVGKSDGQHRQSSRFKILPYGMPVLTE